MVNGIIGKKLGMTQIFAPDGSVTPVTVIKAGPCVVVQRKTVSTDGYEAVQLGLVEDKSPKKVNKPMKGHFAKAGIPPTKILREFRLQDATDEINVGDKVLVDLFADLAEWAIVEFVPKEDPMVRRLLATRRDVFPRYDLDGFRDAAASRFEIVHEAPISDSTRVLFLLRRR